MLSRLILHEKKTVFTTNAQQVKRETFRCCLSFLTFLCTSRDIFIEKKKKQIE